MQRRGIERMATVLRCIALHEAAHRYPPNYRELAEAADLLSLRSVDHYLVKLEKIGAVKRGGAGLQRSLTLTNRGRELLIRGMDVPRGRVAASQGGRT